jgi:hypothetical protein
MPLPPKVEIKGRKSSFCPPLLECRPAVADSHHFDEDPDLDQHFSEKLDPAPDPNLSVAVPQPWFVDPLGLHFEPLELLNFDFNADPDPAFHSNAVLDPQPLAANSKSTIAPVVSLNWLVKPN